MTTKDSDKSPIIGSQLRRARALLLLEPEEVAKEINVKKEDIVSWEKEQTQPRLEKLEALAEIYGREIDYFLRETPEPAKNIEFRGKKGKTLKDLSKETILVLARFDELCRTIIEFENMIDKKLEVKLPKFKESDRPQAVAHNIRDRFKAGSKPISFLRRNLENEGVRIFELPIPGEEFSGFSFWHSDYGPCILADAKETKGRRNFTLAHELAHLLYGHGSSVCYITHGKSHKGLESKANQFAVELLLPKQGVIKDFEKRHLSKSPPKKELAKMANKWSVSIQALGYRLENLGKINRGITDQIVEKKPKHFRAPKTPKWERQLGKRFVDISVEAYNRNLVSVSKLSHTLKIPLRKAMEIVEQRAE